MSRLINEEEKANNAVLAKSSRLTWNAYYSYEAVILKFILNYNPIYISLVGIIIVILCFIYKILEFLDEQVALHPTVASVQTYGKYILFNINVDLNDSHFVWKKKERICVSQKYKYFT